MGEEVQISEYDGDDGARVLDWESGLPSVDDLTPLSQPLIPPELASAFSISPVTFRTAVEVNQASQDTLSSLRGLKSFAAGAGESHESDVLAEEEEDDDEDGDRDSRKARRTEETAAFSGEDGSGRTVKRPRLVWTPQLHKRFVDVVGHLGIKNAVPKTIMQLMNVEGLTRENVASHLQKYRLYLKRMHGLSPSDSSSPSDQHLFESAPPPPTALIPMMVPPPPPPHPYHHHHQHHYSMMQHHHHHQQRNDWAANNYASLVNYPHISPSDN